MTRRESFSVWHEYRGYRFAYGHPSSARYWLIEVPNGKRLFVHEGGQKAVRATIDEHVEAFTCAICGDVPWAKYDDSEMTCECGAQIGPAEAR